MAWVVAARRRGLGGTTLSAGRKLLDWSGRVSARPGRRLPETI